MTRRAEEDEDDSTEMICSMEQLDMAALSSVVTSGVGFSGALATARSLRDNDSVLNSLTTHVSSSSHQTSDEQHAFSTIAINGTQPDSSALLLRALLPHLRCHTYALVELHNSAACFAIRKA